MIISTHFATIGITFARQGITQRKPRPIAAKDLKPKTQVKNLRPRTGSVTEES